MFLRAVSLSLNTHHFSAFSLLSCRTGAEAAQDGCIKAETIQKPLSLHTLDHFTCEQSVISSLSVSLKLSLSPPLPRSRPVML